MDEINDLKREMEDLVAWDAVYFRNREKLMKEIEEIVAGASETGMLLLERY